jgi:hypothetical protein
MLASIAQSEIQAVKLHLGIHLQARFHMQPSAERPQLGHVAKFSWSHLFLPPASGGDPGKTCALGSRPGLGSCSKSA